MHKAYLIILKTHLIFKQTNILFTRSLINNVYTEDINFMSSPIDLCPNKKLINCHHEKKRMCP